MVTQARAGQGLWTGSDGLTRCAWCGTDPLYVAYHDQEWGMPQGDDRRLFEKLCLEGFQAGLSWLTILRKRPAFRAAFAGFDPAVLAGWGPTDVERLAADAGIVRHRGKIRAVLDNAPRALALAREHGSLGAHLWSFEPAPGPGPSQLSLAATSPAATASSADLRRRGWSYVGPTTLHAFMQSMGMVNDHLPGCHRRPAVEAARAAFVPPAPLTGSRPGG